MKPIYLDYNASTPIDERVANAMLPYLHATFGNPTGKHAAGLAARDAVEAARSDVAGFLGCDVEEMTFTSGATEANNMALLGVTDALRARGNHIVISAVEHPSVMNPCLALAQRGFELTVVPVDSTGMVDADAVLDAVTKRTVLVSVMHANNEVGTVQPVARIGRFLRARDVLFHSDAALSAGKVQTNVSVVGADLITLGGHKIYGPKGVGALYVRRGTPFSSLLRGGSQQGGRRAGTESALLAVGMGAACALAGVSWQEDGARMLRLRDRLHAALSAGLPGRVRLLGHATERLPSTLCVAFADVDARTLLDAMPHVAASAGGASCSKGAVSATLAAMGETCGKGIVRFSVGRGSTEAEVDAAAHAIVSAVLQR